MSRKYELALDVYVPGYDSELERKTFEACQSLFPFEDFEVWDSFREDGRRMVMVACGELATDDFPSSVFARKLAEAVWKATGRFLRVELRATDLEDLPYDTTVMDEDDFRQWKSKGG